MSVAEAWCVLACAGHLGCGSLSESRRPGPVISFMPVRDINVYFPSCEWWSELCGRKVVLRVRMPVMEQLCVVAAAPCEWLASQETWLYHSVAEAGMQLLSLFLSSVQMEHQRNLGYMGFCGHREPISFVRRVVIWGSVGVAGSVERFFPEFLTVRRTLFCPWSPSGIMRCAFRG